MPGDQALLMGDMEEVAELFKPVEPSRTAKATWLPLLI